MMLSNLAKLSSNNEFNTVSTIYNNLQTKIADIDEIVNCINHIDISSESINNFNPNIVNFDNKQKLINIDLNLDTKSDSSNYENYIECYGNC